ncbi:hypothetical protein MPSEU_000885000 [Mayamaea pseudoterrestris]|nr:hypothetical protein MPSEU_000885000 [Mayamaea pseudoterrestris]
MVASLSSLTVRAVCMVLLPILGLLVTFNIEIMQNIQTRLTVNKTNQSNYYLHYIDHNREQPRPRHLRLVFMGDSMTRYQYLSLAYFLSTGIWFEYGDDNDEDEEDLRNKSTKAPQSLSDSRRRNFNLMQAHSFHNPLKPHDDWNEFFRHSNQMLAPNEICDCERSADYSIAVERRYFWEKTLDNKLVYINLNGHEGTSNRTGFYGRMDARRVFHDLFDDQFKLTSGFASNITDSAIKELQWTNIKSLIKQQSLKWEAFSWGQVLQRHVAALGLDDLGSVPVVFNAGLHKHNFPDAAEDLIQALNQTNMHGVWKTTTYTKGQLLKSSSLSILPCDVTMCALLPRCLNVSWTSLINPDLYSDRLHFHEPVYRVMNEELLNILGVLPKTYHTLKLVMGRLGAIKT